MSEKPSPIHEWYPLYNDGLSSYSGSIRTPDHGTGNRRFACTMTANGVVYRIYNLHIDEDNMNTYEFRVSYYHGTVIVVCKISFYAHVGHASLTIEIDVNDFTDDFAREVMNNCMHVCEHFTGVPVGDSHTIHISGLSPGMYPYLDNKHGTIHEKCIPIIGTQNRVPENGIVLLRSIPCVYTKYDGKTLYTFDDESTIDDESTPPTTGDGSQ